MSTRSCCDGQFQGVAVQEVVLVEYINNVDSEGGPFLIADATVMIEWHGSDGDGSDYQHACDVLMTAPQLPAVLLPVGSGQALVWETEGAGTGNVFIKRRGELVIVRAWLDESDGDDADDELESIMALAELPLNEPITLGSLNITSGVLAILWSPENGECIESLDISSLGDDKSERPSGDMTTDASGLLVAIEIGNYTCLHDEIELGNASARRCHLIKQEPPAEV